MSVRLTVQLTVKPGTANDFKTAAKPALARVKREDAGCEMYDLFQSVDDETRFVMVESWASDAELDAHMKSPTMGDVGKALGAFIGGAPVMHKYKD
jgi:quinol monooxygenase YgiN